MPAPYTLVFPKRRKERGGTAAALASLNEALLARELCFETDTRKFKLGDGSTTWNSLDYFDASALPITDVGGYFAANDAEAALQEIGANYATKQELSAAISGLSWKHSVRFRTTANVNLAGGGLANGTTHDGVTAATGDRVLVPAQTDPKENGIYIVPASGAASRATDADSGAELVNASVLVDQGTLYAETQWTQSTNAPITLGASNIVWMQFNVGGSLSDGDYGDIIVSGGGASFAIDAGVISNSHINASAAIAVSKLSALTAGRAIVSDGSGFLAVSAATSTEVGYLSGVTSSIQTQLGAKQAADATLTALAAADWVANALPIGTGADTLAQTAFAANTFPARASTGNLVAKTITDDALALLADADVPRLSTANLWTGVNTLRHEFRSTDQGRTSIAQNHGGLLLTAAAMSGTSKYTGIVGFGSTDTQLTTANPKLLAAVVGFATEAYAADADGGMGVAIFGTPNAPGTSPSLTEIANFTVGLGLTLVTPLALSSGGLGVALTDPNADRINFWDDSAGSMAWLAPDSTLSISGTTLSLSTTNNPVGKHAFPIVAGSMAPRGTGGCGPLTRLAGAAGQPDEWYLPFDGATEEYAEFGFTMPEGWNEGTITAKFKWLHGSGSGDVVWGLQAVAVGDGDAFAVNFGTAQEVTDTSGTANTYRTTSETAAITVAGSPAAGDRVKFRVYRKAADAADTLNGIDAYLVEVVLYITTNAATDA